MIDIHCHAEHGQQDALAVGKLASESGMYGDSLQVDRQGGQAFRRADGRRAAAARGSWPLVGRNRHCPIKAWGGYALCRDGKPPSREKVTSQVKAGVSRVLAGAGQSRQHLFSRRWQGQALGSDGGCQGAFRSAAVGAGAEIRPPCAGREGSVEPEYDEAIRIIADNDRALSFGHSTHQEIFALAELVDKLKFKRAFIDHPFSPFVDITVEQMKQLSKVGIHFNFTYDELSPMLGVDPGKMYAAIRTVGVEHFTLSSDAGDTVFPNSVEAMRATQRLHGGIRHHAERGSRPCASAIRPLSSAPTRQRR